jgi:CHAT domain-containing protein
MSHFFQYQGFRYLFWFSLTLWCFLSVFPDTQLPEQAVAQLPASNPWIQQGLRDYQAGAFNAAIAHWEAALQQSADPQERATLHRQLGQAYRQVGKWDRAIGHWQQAIQIHQARSDTASREQLAQILTQQAQAYSELGQHQQAISRLQSAIEVANAIPNLTTVAIAQGALGRAYWGSGNYDAAIAAYHQSQDLAHTQQHPDSLIATLNNLGNVYVSRAEQQWYRAKIACLDGEQPIAANLITRVGQDVASAQVSFQAAISTSQHHHNGLAAAQAHLNLSRLQARLGTLDRSGIAAERLRALTLLQAQPNSREKAYLLINLAASWLSRIAPEEPDTIDPSPDLATGLSLQPLHPSPISLCDRLNNAPEIAPASSPLTTDRAEFTQIAAILQQAIGVARTIGDGRAESYALGTLGWLYRQTNPAQAMHLTLQAQLAAQNAGADDSLYRWQWHTGKLLRAEGKLQSAIASYRQAIATLKTIRTDIIVASRDLQFDFRDSVEPIYRELIELLLEQPSAASNKGTAAPSRYTSETLAEVLDVLESLKLAELQNFFGDDCVEVPQFRSNHTSAFPDRSAIIYSILLKDRTELILRLPETTASQTKQTDRAAQNQEILSSNDQLLAYSIPIGRQQMQKEIEQLRILLEDRATFAYRDQAQKIYDVLIRPLEADLAATKPDTVVFINDGALRNIPMAALHDGQQFLLEKYAIAVTPGLRLTGRQSSDRSNLQALILGLTVPRENFAALAFVGEEIAGVQQILGGIRLLDGQFNVPLLQEHLQKSSYAIVHIATHGKFGPDAESTYLLGFDGKLRINELDNLLRLRPSLQPVELLTLSACETAAGDNRAALGIAGVAVRAGVKSAVATLWSINDAATVPLIKEFYHQLRQPQVTKAEALRRAQLSLIQSRSLCCDGQRGIAQRPIR